ncbi:MAG: hypothetical protein JW880_05410 [Candidatus Thermoplasmatota archaeon]|nr:hypothetical protein [Candidatus Thermoplasmatota archaeon]
MKFLYCPNCKEVRAKAWYQVRPQCSRCMGRASQIVVPNGPLTYLTYFLYFFVPGLVAVSLITDDKTYLWYAIVGLVLMVTVAMIDLGRGYKLAKKKVRIAASDLHEFRKRGWL